jgi:glutaredoxin-related protein
MAPAFDSIILWTQNIVTDIEGTTGPRVAITPNISVQLMQCSKAIVSQIAEVDMNSRTIIPGSLTPEIEKRQSKWQAYDTIPRTFNETSLIGGASVSHRSTDIGEANFCQWAEIVTQTPRSGISNEADPISLTLAWGEVYVPNFCAWLPPF